MGIKDNFQQALRELTGTEKDDQQHEQPVDAMKNAVSADDKDDYYNRDSDSIQYEEIQRRAAAAANEYNRQQDAFNSGEYNDPDAAMQSGTFGASSFDPSEDDMLAMNRSSGNIPFVEPLQPGVTAVPPPPRQNDAQQGGYYQQTQQQSGYYQQIQQNYDQQYTNSYRQSGLNMGDNRQQFQQQSQQTRRQAAAPHDPASEQSAIFSTQRYSRPMNDDDEITMISRNTVIDGNIRSFANMSVDGNVKGNIETTKDIDLNGKVVGNISCNNAQMRTSQIQGNIRMKGNAYMERDTLLIGDITATYANVNGKIKGNLSTTGKSELKSDAVIFGDISASTITVNDGAIIQGYVSTTFLNKEESSNIFPDTITIGE